jgi:hypothetical protein
VIGSADLPRMSQQELDALSRNPTATISALAERAAFLMIHDRELAR